MYMYLHLNLKAVLNSTSLNCVTEFMDQIWIKVNLTNQDNLVAGCIYKSPKGSREDFINMVNLVKQIADLKQTHMLIMGDFNFKEIDWAQGETTVGEEHIAILF